MCRETGKATESGGLITGLKLKDNSAQETLNWGRNGGHICGAMRVFVNEELAHFL